jgi:hypothetical protein
MPLNVCILQEIVFLFTNVHALKLKVRGKVAHVHAMMALRRR